MIVRVVLAALVVAVVALAIVALTSGPAYQVRLLFRDASGLVTGDSVLIGPSQVGSVQSIGLTPGGQAAVVIGLDGDAAPLRRGTVARIVANGLAGIASHYITLQPAAAPAPAIASGGTISESNTYSEVSLDQLFDTFNPLTRAGIRNLIRGQATSIAGRAADANRTLQYLDPALASTSQVTAELSRYEGQFDELLVKGSLAMQALASRSQQLTSLVSNTEQATGAIAQQSTALADSLALLPGTLSKSTATFAGLRRTLDALDPVVAAATPGARELPQLTTELDRFATTAGPTATALTSLIRSDPGLVTLLRATPPLAAAAATAVPALVTAMNASQPQLDYLRYYTPDVVGALTNLGQAGAYFDANGHYLRTQPFFGAFGLSAANQLTSRPPSQRYHGLQVVHGRCPGAAVQPAPDHSAPRHVPGCRPSSTPPGP